MKGLVCSGVVCASAGLCALAVGQPPPPVGGGKVEAAGPRQPGGLLGDHLGNYLTIEGVRAEGGKVETGTLLVDTVDAKKLTKPIPVLIRTPDHPARRFDLPAKQRCVLKGYESGEMIGTPPAVLAAAKEHGRKDVGESQAVWQWRPYFVALIVVEPKGLEIPRN